MSKTAVIFKSKSGYTKKYAQWIALEAGAELIEARKVKPADMDKYDTIVYGGGLYAVGINGLKLIKKNLDRLKDKRIIVFASCASPVRDEVFKEVRDRNFSEQELKSIDFYMMRGGFEYSRLTLLDKFLMQLLKMQLKSKKELTSDERGMLNSYDHPVDFTNKKYIKPIVDAIAK